MGDPCLVNIKSYLCNQSNRINGLEYTVMVMEILFVSQYQIIG